MSDMRTVYIVCCDISKGIDDVKKSIRLWLTFLGEALPHRPTYRVIVVGTKSDLVTDEGSLRMCLRHLQQVIDEKEELPIRQLLLASSNQADSIRLVTAAIREQATQLLAEPQTLFVPHRFVRMRESVLAWQQQPTHPVFLTFSRLQASFPDLDTACIEFLHSVGCVVYNPRSQLVCLRPQFLSKVAAIFLAPNEHLARISPELAQSLSSRNPVVPRREAERRLRDLLQCRLSKDDLAILFEGLEQFDLCYRVSAGQVKLYSDVSNQLREEDGFLFPILRPVAELVGLPPIPLVASTDVQTTSQPSDTLSSSLSSSSSSPPTSPRSGSSSSLLLEPPPSVLNQIGAVESLPARQLRGIGVPCKQRNRVAPPDALPATAQFNPDDWNLPIIGPSSLSP